MHKQDQLSRTNKRPLREPGEQQRQQHNTRVQGATLLVRVCAWESEASEYVTVCGHPVASRGRTFADMLTDWQEANSVQQGHRGSQPEVELCR